MPAKKRQTIRANPLDEIEVTAKSSKTSIVEKSQPEGKNKTRSSKKLADATTKASQNKGISKFASAEDVFNAVDVEVSSPGDVKILQPAKSIKANREIELTAEDIFNDEVQTSRELVVLDSSNDLRKVRANKCVLLWSWVSVPTALIPLVVVDVAVTIGIQVKMIKDLCRIYGVPFKNENARAFISALIGGGVASVASSGLKNMILKSLPHVGTTIAFLAQPALGFSTTYALGQVFTRHLENDGGLDNFDAEKMRISFREQLEKGKELFKRGRNKASAEVR